MTEQHKASTDEAINAIDRARIVAINFEKMFLVELIAPAGMAGSEAASKVAPLIDNFSRGSTVVVPYGWTALIEPISTDHIQVGQMLAVTSDQPHQEPTQQ